LPWRVVRRFKHIGLLLLLLVTAYLAAGRCLMPLLSTQKTAVEARLSQALGLPVTLGSLQGAWFRFGPVINLQALQIGTVATGRQSLGHAQVAFDVLASLWAGQPVISHLTVENVSLILQEVAPGRWTLAGLTGGNNSIDPLLDFWLQTNELTLNQAELTLQRLNGEQLRLHSGVLNLQNSGLSHELQLQVRINDQDSPAHVIAQLQGDPRRNFYAKLWMDTSQVDWLPLVKSSLPTSWQWQQLQGRAQVWAEIDSNGLENFKTVLSDVTAQSVHNDAVHAVDIQQGQLQLSARPRYARATASATAARGWEVRIQDIALDWQNTPWELSDLQVSRQAGDAQPWVLATNTLELSLLQQLLTTVVPLPTPAHQAVLTLAPEGRLQHVRLQTALDGSDPQGFLLRANLENVAVQAWQQAPAGKGIQGYVEANARGGFIEVDSQDFTLHLPLLFEPWHYDKVNARVDWRASPDHVQVQSALIRVANAQLQGQVSFAVENTRDQAGHWLSDFMLQVGVEKMQVETVPAYLPTLSRMRVTNAWLQAALQGGEVVDSGFVLHQLSGSALASLVTDTSIADVTQNVAWYRLQQGSLKFLPDWPMLTGIEAAVIQRNNDVDILAHRASLAGLEVANASASIRTIRDTRLDATSDERAILAVHATTAAPTQTGLEFLRNTPVHNTLGTFLDTWQATGEIGIDVGIGVDLGNKPTPPHIDVLTNISNSQLNLADIDLQFEAIDGAIHYSSKQGLSADKLQARLFAKPITASISTEHANTPTQSIVIAGQGKAALSALQSWSGQPSFVRALFGYMDGDVDYHARVSVEPAPLGGNKVLSLQLSSDLVGLTSKLPQPLGKTVAEVSPFAMELRFQSPQKTLLLRYRDWLTGELHMDAQGIQRGQISVGDRNRNFTVRQVDAAAVGVLVTGDMGSFDFPAWKDIASQLNQAGGEGRAVADYLRMIEVNVGELILPGLNLKDAKVLVQHPQDAWLINTHNEFLSGDVTVPDQSSQPWKLALEYLRFPPRAEVDPAHKPAVDDELDPLQAVDPTALPAFDFSTKELSVGMQNLGSFAFQFRPHTLGASITNFQMTSPDSRITDTTQTFGASIDWQFMNGKHRSSFKGLFSAGDLAKVLPAWGHDANLVSKSASFDSDLDWPGSPLHFSLKRASGTVDLTIDTGRFVDSSSLSLTRVFSPLNFDALVRRLQLDFSDIFAKGYSFDSIDGLLSFSNGVVTTTTPLEIDGPSSDLSLTGIINLRDETIDADMQVQIPLGQNVSMVIGLLGAWPIAVSTYLAGKIFQEQVEDFTTVIYRLEGPWADPTAGFEPPDDAAAKTTTKAVKR
jgi:uncharacterized protein (TIGR02099 family)